MSTFSKVAERETASRGLAGVRELCARRGKVPSGDRSDPTEAIAETTYMRQPFLAIFKENG